MLFKDCAHCSHLMRDGMCRGTADWWPIKEIWFCRIQNMFLIEQLLPLPLGTYPPDTYLSGYTEAPRTSFRGGSKAPYESALALRGELTRRLDRTGDHGKWLIREVQNGVGLGELPYEPRCALHYVSGWWPKIMPYEKWRWQQEHRKKPHWIVV